METLFHRLCASVVVLLLVTTAPSFAQTKSDLKNELAAGFVRAIKAESVTWYECGEKTPKEKWDQRAFELVEAILDALAEFDVKINPWGVLGTVFNESRGNRCAIGPNPRKVAHARNLVNRSDWRLWTEHDVLKVVKSPDWNDRPADLGLGQVVWRRFARIEEDGKVRIPTVEEMLSLKDGARIVAYAMKQRMKYKHNRRWRNLPWYFWPGVKANFSYGRKVAYTVKKMGGPYRSLLSYK